MINRETMMFTVQRIISIVQANTKLFIEYVRFRPWFMTYVNPLNDSSVQIL